MFVTSLDISITRMGSEGVASRISISLETDSPCNVNHWTTLWIWPVPENIYLWLTNLVTHLLQLEIQICDCFFYFLVKVKPIIFITDHRIFYLSHLSILEYIFLKIYFVNNKYINAETLNIHYSTMIKNWSGNKN